MERHRGVNLPELVFAVAITLGLLGWGIPALRDLRLDASRAAEVNQFIQAVYLARSEAIKRRSRAVMCISATGSSCASSGDWHQGWKIFHDANNNAELDSDEAVIQNWQALSAGIRLTGNSPVSRSSPMRRMVGANRLAGHGKPETDCVQRAWFGRFGKGDYY